MSTVEFEGVGALVVLDELDEFILPAVRARWRPMQGAGFSCVYGQPHLK
jgi:hypothetical protein